MRRPLASVRLKIHLTARRENAACKADFQRSGQRERHTPTASAIASDTEYGLSSSIVTSDLERGEELALQIESGMTHMNDQTVNDSPVIPFGGNKASGSGRFDQTVKPRISHTQADKVENRSEVNAAAAVRHCSWRRPTPIKYTYP